MKFHRGLRKKHIFYRTPSNTSCQSHSGLLIEGWATPQLGGVSLSSVQESRLVTNELLEWNIRTWTGIVIQNVVPSLIFPSYSNSGSIHLLHLLRRLIVVSWMDGQPYHSFSYWVWGCDRMEMLWNVLLSVFHCLASSGPC